MKTTAYGVLPDMKMYTGTLTPELSIRLSEFPTDAHPMILMALTMAKHHEDLSSVMNVVNGPVVKSNESEECKTVD